MCRFQPTLMLGFCAALSGCDTSPSVCTASFAMITATVVDGTGQALSEVSVTDTVRRTGAVLDVTQDIPPLDPGTAVIFSDAFLSAIRPAGDDVTVVATAEAGVGSAQYRFGSDGCHVRKLAGPDTLVAS
jgi:hypothetical protein